MQNQKLLPVVGIIGLLVGVWLLVFANGDNGDNIDEPTPAPIKQIEPIKPRPGIFKPKPGAVDQPPPSLDCPPSPPIPQGDQSLKAPRADVKQYTPIQPLTKASPPCVGNNCPYKKADKSVENKSVEASQNQPESQNSTIIVRKRGFRRY